MNKYIKSYDEINESILNTVLPNWGNVVDIPGWNLGSGSTFFGRNPKKKIKRKARVLGLREFLEKHKNFNK